MRRDLRRLPGLGRIQAEQLADAGIKTSDDLMERCCNEPGRDDVRLRTGLGEQDLIDWVRMIDLLRIEGMNPGDAELLIAAGVSGPGHLRDRDPDALAVGLAEVNERRHLVKHPPSAETVRGWVERARHLEAEHAR